MLGYCAAFVCASAMHENGVDSDGYPGMACFTHHINMMVAGYRRDETTEAAMFVENKHS